MAPSSNNLVIIGGGPAALTAGLYAARAGLATQIFERANIGGLLGEISQLDNYPGFEGAGADLATVMRHQAEAAGVQIQYGECTAVRPLSDGDAASLASPASSTPNTSLTSSTSARLASSDDSSPSKLVASSVSAPRAGFELIIDGVAVRAGAVLVATGASPKPLPFSVTPPVSYCALCDGALAKGRNVVVVGGANAAVQESLYLSRLAQTVTIITHSKLKADAILQNQLAATANITVIEEQEPTPDFLNQFDYVFVFIGRQPATGFLGALASEHQLLDSKGYILTKKYMTAISGLFAAGDVRAGSLRQVVTAAGDGANAATAISAWLTR